MYPCYCCLFKIRFLSYYNIPLGAALTEAMRLANNKIKCFHVTFEQITFYRRFVIWQRNHFTEMQMGYKVLFVMLLNAKATLVYTGHVSKQDLLILFDQTTIKNPSGVSTFYSDIQMCCSNLQMAYHVNDCAAWKGTFTPTLSVHILLVL